MDRYDPYTDKFLRDTQYNILGTNLAEVGTDCISRQAALDIFDDYNVAVENGQIEAYSRDRKRLCDLPPAQTEKRTEERTETHACDCISRQAAIERATKEHDFFRDAVTVSDKARRDELLNVMCWLGELPSAQPEYHEIGYRECADAVLKMWMDNVLTDGEYNRIIDKLNAKWAIAEGDAE